MLLEHCLFAYQVKASYLLVSMFYSIDKYLEHCLMQPSKSIVFACFYVLFDKFYVIRWDFKLF